MPVPSVVATPTRSEAMLQVYEEDITILLTVTEALFREGITTEFTLHTHKLAVAMPIVQRTVTRSSV